MASHFASDPQWDDEPEAENEAEAKLGPAAGPDAETKVGPDAEPGAASAAAFAEPAAAEDRTAARAPLADPALGSASHGSSEPPASKKRVWPLVVLLVVLLAIAAAGISFIVYYNARQSEAAQAAATEEKPATPQETTVDSQTQLAQNPIDFATLQSENSDIFAWLYIPGCDINTPIFQSPTDDLFYLWRNKDGEEDLYGVPFIQLCNSTDLGDPVTVVYGHRNSGAFENLLQFQDKEFFDANTEFYVYVPGHIYTYTVVSSYIYDTRHIMNSFNFSKQDVVDEYFDFVMNPDSITSNVNSGVSLSSDSKLLQLSTCSTTHGESDGRYIVSAVRTGDQATS